MSSAPIRATIISMQPLTDSILQLVVSPETYVPYEAGQYLQWINDGEAFCYSIANAPLGTHQYELHIRHGRDNHDAMRLLAKLKQDGSMMIRLPFGDCHIKRLSVKKPILFIASGTGFAPVNAMMEQLLMGDAGPRRFELYWGARSQSDLYMDDKVMRWHRHVPDFSHLSLLPQARTETLIADVLARHEADVSEWQWVICGPFDLAYTLRDTLVERGFSSVDLFSDSFSFERSKR